MSLERLSASEIVDLISGINDSDLGISIIVLDSVSSTNDYVFDLLKVNNSRLNKTAVLSEQQTSGKGRLGRSWVSPPGNIYLSLYWPFSGTLSCLYGLSIVIGIAVVRVLKRRGVEDVCLKWPNDIMWHGHKLGGILIETKQGRAGVIDLVIGIGLNLKSMDEHANEINQKFADLESVTQRVICRNELVAQLLVEISGILDKFALERFDCFVAEWKSLDLNSSP